MNLKKWEEEFKVHDFENTIYLAMFFLPKAEWWALNKWRSIMDNGPKINGVCSRSDG